MKNFTKTLTAYTNCLVTLTLTVSCSFVGGNKGSRNKEADASGGLKLPTTSIFSETDSSKIAIQVSEISNKSPYELKSIKIKLAEVKDKLVEIKPENETLSLLRVSFDHSVKVTQDSAEGKITLNCFEANVPILLTSFSPCKVVPVEPSNPNVPGGTPPTPTPIIDEKIPATITSDIEKSAWASMIEQCKANPANQLYRDANSIALGCYCKIPDLQIPFAEQFVANNSSPVEFAKTNFKMKCDFVSNAMGSVTPITEQMHQACRNATGGVDGFESCTCPEKDNMAVQATIEYKSFYSKERPVSAFFQMVREKCSVIEPMTPL